VSFLQFGHVVVGVLITLNLNNKKTVGGKGVRMRLKQQIAQRPYLQRFYMLESYFLISLAVFGKLY